MAKKDLIDQALRLRVTDRLSLKEIANRLNISKSTASVWLRNNPLLPDEISARRNAYNCTPVAQEHIRTVGKLGRKSEKRYLPITELKSWGKIRKRIFEERGRICEKCGWCEQNPFNGIVPVQVDHINGDSKDHRMENLIVLCPNCHSMTEHYMFYGRSHGDKYGKKGTKRYR